MTPLTKRILFVLFWALALAFGAACIVVALQALSSAITGYLA